MRQVSFKRINTRSPLRPHPERHRRHGNPSSSAALRRAVAIGKKCQGLRWSIIDQGPVVPLMGYPCRNVGLPIKVLVDSARVRKPRFQSVGVLELEHVELATITFTNAREKPVMRQVVRDATPQFERHTAVCNPCWLGGANGLRESRTAIKRHASESMRSRLAEGNAP